MESARRATVEDLADIDVLLAAARSELASERGARVLLAHEVAGADAAARLHDPDGLVLVGSLDDVVVGVALARIDTLADATQLAVLDALYVEPEARAVGVGEALLDEVVSWAKERGCRGLDSYALPGMRDTKNFFEGFGLVARAIVVHRPL